MLTPAATSIIAEQRLGFVATVNADGTPNLSPKGTFVIIDPATLAYGDVRSPGTRRNVAAGSNVEVNFVDPFTRKGCRIKGHASLDARGSAAFDDALPAFAQYGDLSRHFSHIVRIHVTAALPLQSPAYDRGADEATLRRRWTRHFRLLQPGQTFNED
jgi:uncharacterized protein